ncbi:NUDIX hydrolase [Natranaerofaba carboxydovora]|uniref:NUDIX hydrolase n=1 Tax=Natranaerofaba carboxydovora TaxID=2742683 RepID=UPI001F128DE1|nr:NUDIX hydrolase [Natranaerofaba carboxydovora]UMZ73929.1 ADP-ribose pyrophosphatase [Natranaerofaba carboxydovora]
MKGVITIKETTTSKEVLYEGKIINVELHKIINHVGTEGVREVVKHPGAVVILPITSEGYVYLARQFRKPIEKELLELPAGKLDDNEPPVECAIRELKEELNLKASDWTYLTSVYTSPGFTDEKMFFYVAKDLTICEGKADDDEVIEMEKIHYDELWDKILQGEIEDGKTVLSVTFYSSLKNK